MKDQSRRLAISSLAPVRFPICAIEHHANQGLVVKVEGRPASSGIGAFRDSEMGLRAAAQRRAIKAIGKWSVRRAVGSVAHCNRIVYNRARNLTIIWAGNF